MAKIFFIIQFVNYFDMQIKYVSVEKSLYSWDLWHFALRQYSFIFPLLHALSRVMLYLAQHVVIYETKYVQIGAKVMENKILICKNCIEECNDLMNQLENNSFNVIVAPRDGNAVISYIEEQNPIMVICEAFMPNKDAITIMQHFKNVKNKPKFIIISSSNNIFLEKEIIKHGASYFVLKPFSTSSLISIIKTVIDVVPPKKVPLKLERSLEEQVTKMIHQIGVPAHIKGYHYLRKGIIFCVENNDMINSVTKTLYPSIAKWFHTTPSRVERAIRHAIEVAWDRGDVDILNSYFGYTIHNGRGKPTNSEFMAMLSDKIKLQLHSDKIEVAV